MDKSKDNMDKKVIFWGLIVAIFLAIAISPFASPWPDGLEKVAEDKGFLKKGEVEPPLRSPIPDYTWPGIKNEKLATAIAGVVGTLIVFGAGYGLAALINRRKTL
jgi:cobalt/nickel transport protein